jgi:hypothetical protein
LSYRGILGVPLGAALRWKTNLKIVTEPAPDAQGREPHAPLGPAGKID